MFLRIHNMKTIVQQSPADPLKQKIMVTGAEAIILSLLQEHTEVVFGYIGGAIMPTFDSLDKYKEKINFFMARHEQGVIHAAQGYARTTGKPGVCIVTSGPGATNLVTGLADAMLDSTPVVCITGQTYSSLLGSDAFQEANMMSITSSVTKWNYQVTKAEEIPAAMAKAFFIATTGRPGPVLIDMTKDAQSGKFDFAYKKCNKIRSYDPLPKAHDHLFDKAAELINNAKKPFLLVGQGILLSQAEKELSEFIEKTGIPFGCTLHGLSAMPRVHKLNMGLLGMHGNLGPNLKTNACDVLIAIGMRFDDRVTSNTHTYAKQASIIHIDIDASELNKNVDAEIAIQSDAKYALEKLLPKVSRKNYSVWIKEFRKCYIYEFDNAISQQLFSSSENIKMGEVINAVSKRSHDNAVIVTDVGQHQMMCARYYNFKIPRSFVTSGGLGTMGFGLPAAVGAKIANPDKQVILFVGDGGFQMTIQELGTIMQYHLNIKIVILNNGFLGMVRQWQELFFDKRYVSTEMTNPDFMTLARSYGIKSEKIFQKEKLDDAIDKMLSHNSSFILEIIVEKEQNVFPMVPAGESITQMRFS
jgi:acetolactate synthase-1/2/3 large subunit